MNKIYVSMFCVLFSMFALPASAQEAPEDIEEPVAITEETIAEEVVDEIVVEETTTNESEPTDGVTTDTISEEAEVQSTETGELVDDSTGEPETTEVEEVTDESGNTQESTTDPETVATEAEAAEEPETINIPQIYISEINWAGSNLSNADEWIELYNADSESVDLGGWVLTGSATSGESLMLADGTALNPGLALLISNYKLGDEKTTLAVEPDLVSSALSLSNSKLEIILAMADGTVVDEISSSGTPDFGSSDPKASMTRNLATLEWTTSDYSTNLLDETQMGTPGTVSVAEVAEVAQDLDELQEVVEPINSGDLVIAEFVSDPTNEIEWVSIFNFGLEAIDLTGWTIQDATEKPTELGEISLESGEYLVVENPKGRLNNDGDTITLIDVDGNVIASVTYGTESVPAPSKGESLIYQNGEWTINELEVSDETSAEEIIEDQTTETDDEVVEETEAEESIVEKESEVTEEETQESTSYDFGTLVINEFVSDSEDGSEWIEIFNPGSESISLTGWSVSDATDKQTGFEALEIQPGAYVVIENPKGKLNNGSDDIKLTDPSGNVIDIVSYSGVTAPNKGESLARNISLEWEVTNQITKGEKNEYEQSIQEPKSDSNETTESRTDKKPKQTAIQNSEQKRQSTDSTVSNETETHRVIAIAEPTKTVQKKTSSSSSSSKSASSSSSSKVTITGIVTAIPDTFGSQIAYIDGTQLYFYYADWPELAVGDLVSITGEESSNRGEYRIKISDKADIKVTSSSSLISEPATTATALASDTGSLVTVTGSIVERNGSKLVIEDETGAITVIAHGNSDIAWSAIESSRVQITGIMRQMGDEMRLYPRSINDVVALETFVEKQDALPVISGTSGGRSTPWIGLGLLGACFGALSYWFFRNRKLRHLQTTN